MKVVQGLVHSGVCVSCGRTDWVGSLCLSKSGGVLRMCVGAVESVKRVVISEKYC